MGSSASTQNQQIRQTHGNRQNQQNNDNRRNPNHYGAQQTQPLQHQISYPNLHRAQTIQTQSALLQRQPQSLINLQQTQKVQSDSRMLQQSQTPSIQNSHLKQFQIPQVPFLPIMTPNKLSVRQNNMSIRIKTVKIMQEGVKCFITFIFDTRCKAGIQVYAFVTEQQEIISKLTLQCYNFLSMDQQTFDKPVVNQQFKSRFFIDFSKIQAVQLKQQGPFWPLIIRMEALEVPESEVNFYYFEIIKEGNQYIYKIKQQKLEVNFSAFEIKEIYGIEESGLSNQEESKDSTLQKNAKLEDQDRECIICFCEKIDTIIMPCRHMCICIQCASLFQQKKQDNSHQKNNNNNLCPVCRKDIESFIHIKKEGD